LRLDAPDLRPLADFADLPLDRGGLTLDARFDTGGGRAGAEATLAARGLRFADVVADIGALDLDATALWDGRRANADLSISGPFERPFTARASLPLRPSGGPVPVAPAGGALEGAVDWEGRIEEIWALVPAPGHILAGATRVALTIGGTLDAPTIGGDVAISDGRYENLDVGAILVDLDADSRIAPDGAFVLEIDAEDGAGGPVAAVISVADGAVDAKIDATNATLVRRDDVTASLSIDLAAQGPLAGPDVAGTITIDRAEVRLVAATPPGVADLGPVRIKGEEPDPPEPSAGEDVALDVKIVAPNDVFVRGRGLDSEWSIDLAVTGTAADPRIRGEILRRRGVLSFLGRDFDLERGAIRFTGARGIDPTLDVQLLRENDGITGGIAVSGTAQAPDVSFTSRPALPEEEVLPRVLFGRSKQSLSPAEALTLGVGVATLLDGGGGAVDGVRGAVGLDVLRVDDDAETGTSVTVGSNVADGVFVGAKQPVAGGSASVQVEVEVFDNITVDSEFGRDVGTSIGLNWKRDF
ncbi:MAG: translocation/assembly module TamB domain-containing protein, partial [Pseudomonadota bacterium]